jgi:Ca-activated chloride channel family protein
MTATILWRDPWSFAGLVLVAGLGAFLVWARHRRARALAAFVAAALQPTVAPDVDPRRRALRAGLLVAAAGLIVLALAGPMWGFRWEQVRRQGIDLVIALDTSRSMLATDVKPDRLARAKLAVRDLVAEARGDRLALVPFAGTAFLLCPLTLDTGAFLQSLAAVEVGIIPRGGTTLPAAIDASLAAFEGREASHQAVVLITDGESHEGDLDAALATAKERGVRIFTVGIGTPEGELVPGDGGAFFKDRRGQVVKSRLDEATLERIAVDTGGVYLRAAGAGLGLPELYRDHIATLDKRELESTLERRYELRYQLPLGLAFLLLLVERLIGDRPGRRGWWRWRGAAAAALLGFMSVGWLDPHAVAREGNRLYDQGKFDEAAERYNQALVDEPDSGRLHFNLGDARYKSGKYDEALGSFAKVPPADDQPTREARLAYNVGNTKYRQGEALEAAEPQKTLGLWAEALVAYRRALAANPDDGDARWNHELVERKIAALRKKLEEQKQQQDQQQQQNQQQGEKKQDEQQQSEKQQGDDRKQGDQQEQQGDQHKQAEQGGEGDQAPPPSDEARDEQQHGEQPGEEQAQGQEEEQERPGANEQAGEHETTGGAEQGGQRRDGSPDEAGRAAQGAGGEREMTREEAAALLDAQRTQEVQPGEIVQRQQKARVAEPLEDW